METYVSCMFGTFIGVNYTIIKNCISTKRYPDTNDIIIMLVCTIAWPIIWILIAYYLYKNVLTKKRT